MYNNNLPIPLIHSQLAKVTFTTQPYMNVSMENRERERERERERHTHTHTYTNTHTHTHTCMGGHCVPPCVQAQQSIFCTSLHTKWASIFQKHTVGRQQKVFAMIPISFRGSGEGQLNLRLTLCWLKQQHCEKEFTQTVDSTKHNASAKMLQHTLRLGAMEYGEYPIMAE